MTAPPLPLLPPKMIEIACVVNDEDAVPAAQLIVGLGYDLTEHVTAALCYRFFASFDAEFETGAAGHIVEAQRFGGDFYNHAARAELQYRV